MLYFSDISGRFLRMSQKLPKALNGINSLYNTITVASNNCTVFSEKDKSFGLFRQAGRSFKRFTMAVMNNNMDRGAEVNTEGA